MSDRCRQELRVPELAEPISHYTDAVRFGDLLLISGVHAAICMLILHDCYGGSRTGTPKPSARIWHRRPLGAAHNRCEPDAYVNGAFLSPVGVGLRQLRRAGHSEDKVVSPRLG
jgi:hypothetical protein